MFLPPGNHWVWSNLPEDAAPSAECCVSPSNSPTLLCSWSPTLSSRQNKEHASCWYWCHRSLFPMSYRVLTETALSARCPTALSCLPASTGSWTQVHQKRSSGGFSWFPCYKWSLLVLLLLTESVWHRVKADNSRFIYSFMTKGTKKGMSIGLWFTKCVWILNQIPLLVSRSLKIHKEKYYFTFIKY